MKKSLLPLSLAAFGVLSAQNTGIGTTQPTANLDVVGASSPTFKLRSNADGFRQLWLAVDDAKSIVNYQSTYFDKGVYPHVWSLGNDEVMRLNTTGLGLGFPNPEQRLDVNGNALVRGILMLRNANATHQIFNYGDTASNNPLYLGTGKNTDGSKNSIILYNLSCDGGCNVPQIQLLADRTITGGLLSVGNIPASTGDEDVVVAGTDGVLKRTAVSSIVSSTEPWYNEATNTPATANNQNIYQNGDVTIADNGNLNAPGNKLYFGRGSENTDPLFMYRYNGVSDKSDLRINIGDNDGAENALSDYLVIGNGTDSSNFIEKFRISGSTGQTKIGNGDAGTTGVFQILPNQGTPISTRLVYGTDNSGWKFAIAKNNSGSITDQLVVQDNGNVGIGTTDAQQKLHVNGAFALVQGIANELAYFGGDGAANDVQLGSLNPAVQDISFYNGASAKYMNTISADITAQGNLVVNGTAALHNVPAGANSDAVLVKDAAGLVKQVPASSLLGTAPNIYTADGTVTGPRTVNQNGNNITWNGGEQVYTNGNAFRLVNGERGFIFRNDGAAFYMLPSTDSNGLGNWTEDRPFMYNFETKNLLLNQNNGNVGIGIYSPDAKFHIGSVGDNIRTSVLVNSNETPFKISTYQGTTGANSLVGSLGMEYGTTKNAFVKFYRGGTNTGGSIAFTSNNDNEVMRIASNGYVGIGTSAPVEKLDVAGNIQVSSGAKITSPGRLHITGDETLYLLNKTGVIVSKSWDGNGNLTVEGQTKLIDVPNADNADPILTRDPATGTVRQLTASSISSLTEPWREQGTNAIATNNTQHIYQSGNVMANNAALQSSYSSNEGGLLQLINPTKTGANASTWTLYNMTGNYTNGLNFWRYFADGTNAGPAVTFLDNGNVGIGTSSPLQKLDVAGNYALIRGGGNEQAYIGGDGGGDDVQVGSLNPNIKLVSIYGASGMMDLAAKNTSVQGRLYIGDVQPGAATDNILVRDGNGIVKTIPSSTFSSSNIYNSDGTLTGPRTISMAGNTLHFANGPVQMTNNASALSLVGTDHQYIQFFPRGIAQGRKGFFGFAGAGTNDITINAETAGAKINLSNSTNVAGDLTVTGTIYQTSDAKFKKDVKSLQNGTSTIAALRPVTYTWNDAGIKHGGEANKEQIGFIAQEVEKVLPDAVQTDRDGNKAVNYVQVIPVLTKAVQELKSENDQLKARLDKIEALLNAKK